MKKDKMLEAEIWTVARTEKGNVVLIKPTGSEVAVPIAIGHLEAQSILIGLGSVPMPRPLTHDLFLSVLDNARMELDRVDITELKEETYYARLVLKQGNKQLIIDSRPSDALGIAVRKKCPVFIAEDVVNEAGISINLVIDEDEVIEDAPSPEELERKRLEMELSKAIEEENYEEAARIRDEIKNLN